tara:strand:- start:25291 stop:26514 length:1224 start_codon:yes stop_codon:yes gene_type:complete
MSDNEYDFPVGIDYSNLPSPFGGEDGVCLDNGDKLSYGDNTLTPYVGILAGNIYNNANDSSNYAGIKRFVINVSPLNNCSYPKNGKDKALINIDSNQLYSTDNSDFGIKYTAATPKNCEPLFWGEEGGAYSSPVPMPGLPLKLQKVYFTASRANPEKGYSIAGTSSRYFSYFACSNPIKQDSVQDKDVGCDEPSGTIYNPRDNNYAVNEGVENQWSSINFESSSDFEASGCLKLEVDTETDTVTYGIGRKELLNCLGVYETGIDFVICMYEDNPGTSAQPTTYNPSSQNQTTYNPSNHQGMERTMTTGCCRLGVLLQYGCETTTPQPPMGACCFSIGEPSAICNVTDEASCIASGGVYMGDDVPCGPNTCYTTTTTPIPTTTTMDPAMLDPTDTTTIDPSTSFGFIG